MDVTRVVQVPFCRLPGRVAGESVPQPTRPPVSGSACFWFGLFLVRPVSGSAGWRRPHGAALAPGVRSRHAWPVGG